MYAYDWTKIAWCGAHILCLLQPIYWLPGHCLHSAITDLLLSYIHLLVGRHAAPRDHNKSCWCLKLTKTRRHDWQPHRRHENSPYLWELWLRGCWTVLEQTGVNLKTRTTSLQGIYYPHGHLNLCFAKTRLDVRLQTQSKPVFCVFMSLPM